MMWYHDHAVGITRVNAYVGIATAYIIRDSFEQSLVTGKYLPDYVENGGREIPIVIQDKTFVGSNIATTDPTWTGLSTPGSLWYAHTYDPKRWKLLKSTKTPPPTDPSIIPEFFGDTMLANGTVYPFQPVEARKYRLRILNACQARFLNLQLFVDDGSVDGITLNPKTLLPTNLPGPSFTVIGTEGGFLPTPVVVPSNVSFNPATLVGSLITAPAERWDLIIDFKGFENKKLILYNDSPAPFPMGDPRYDYYPGVKNNPTVTLPGQGPNTRQIMRFDVGAATVDDILPFPTGYNLAPGNDPLPVPLGTMPLTWPGVTERWLTLNEAFDMNGRLLQQLGTNIAPVKASGGFGRAYTDPATEVVQILGGTANEVWHIINLTADTHPIHFHLANAQIISRQAFSSFNGGLPNLSGAPLPPQPYEQGWKETVKMNPGEVTTVYLPFKLPANPPGVATIPLSPRTGGHEYVWHCHILEHEEHDMMRPLVVN